MQEGQNEQTLTHVWCSVELFNSVIGVLQTQPYNAVASVMDGIQKGVKPMHPETLAHAEQVIKAVAEQQAQQKAAAAPPAPVETPPAGPANG